MKRCGECTLCCKIPRIAILNKPSNQWCEHCNVGVGCRIYESRPKVCKDFECLWLHSDMPESMRPDRNHLYVAGRPEDDTFVVRVDTAFPDAWKDSPVCEYLWEMGKHLLISVGNQITFIAGHGRVEPEQIELKWTL